MERKKIAVEPTKLQTSAIPEESSIRSIRYLTCQGGGMKGVGDVGAIEELERCGVLAQIEEVAGSSAGGLIATMLAIGCTPQEVREFMFQLDFRAFQDKKEAGISTIEQEFAEGVYSLIGSIKTKQEGAAPTPSKVLGKLEKLGDVGKLAFGKGLGIWEGDALQYCLAEMIARKTGNPNITFRELAALAGMEGTLYKKLTLTGTNLTDKCGEYYNTETTPDMPIVLATRISASFPGGFKPVIVGEGDQRKVKVDGGLLENLPDVFNKPPYFTGSGGNPEVFALTFDAPADKKARKIKRGHHLLGALYATKMDESEVIRKYGKKVARIDTLDVDTLDFSLSMERKEALAESGAIAVRKSIESILAEETELGVERYQTLSIQELTRIEADILYSIRKLLVVVKDIALSDKLRQITVAIEGREFPAEALKKQRIIAEKRLLKKMAIIKQSAASDDDDLVAICQKKQTELSICQKQLQAKIKDLTRAREALEFNMSIISHAFQESEGNKFSEAIARLKAIEDEIKNCRIDIAHQGANTDALSKLQTAREVMYKEIIDFYEKAQENGENLVLARFFKDMQEDSKRPEFKVLSTEGEIRDYCSVDLDVLDTKIAECLRLSHDNEELSKVYHTHEKNLPEKAKRAERYTALMQLKKELDYAIHRNTTLLTRINNYLVKKAPRFQKPIIGFMQAATVLAYISWVPLASPIGLIALACKKASTKPETRMAADKILHYFNMPDISADTKRRLFRTETVKLIKKLDKNYAEINAAGENDCIVLQSQKMKALKLDFQDIFIRKPGEKRKAYRERVVGFNGVFHQLCAVEKISPPSGSVVNALADFGRTVVDDMHHAASIEHPAARDSHHMEAMAATRRQKTDSKHSTTFMMKKSHTNTIQGLTVVGKFKRKGQPKSQ